MTHSYFLTASILSLVAGLAGCAVDSSTDTSELSARAQDAITPAAPASEVDAPSGVYALVVKRDLRRCVSPMCGGYFVRVLNSGQDQYVSAIDQRELDPITVHQMSAAGDGELVVRGHFGPRERRFHTRPFIAAGAYRGMPGVIPATGDQFYSAADRNPPIECFVAPCHNEVAARLNTDQVSYFDGFSVARASLSLVDQSWLTELVHHSGALVSAKFVDGDRYPGGYERILDASQVFIALPYPDDLCPVVRLDCEPPLVAVFTRSPERCIIPDRCVTPGICPMYMPACPTGYTLQSWLAQPDACPAFACDPTFTVAWDEASK